MYALVTIPQFNGLDTRSADDQITGLVDGGALDGFLKQCVNFNIDHRGRLSVRNGYAQGHALTAGHSLHAMGDGTLLYQDGTSLYTSDGSTPTEIQTGLGASTRLGAVEFTGSLYVHNGTDAYVWDGSNSYPWEIETPSSGPTLNSSGSGKDLHAGQYTYVVTYLRGYKESPPSAIATVTITAGQQVDLTAIPTPSDASIDGKRLYRTTCNGSVDDGLKWCQDLGVADTTATDTLSDHKLQYDCQTLGMRGPFGSSVVLEFRGRVFQANGEFVQWSEPGAPWLFRERNHAYHGETVRMLARDRGGVYVASYDRVDYLQGWNPESPEYVQIPVSSEYGALRCDPVYVNEVPYWLSKRGFVRGANGSVEVVTQPGGGYRFDPNLSDGEAWLEYDPVNRMVIAIVSGGSTYVLNVETGAVWTYTNYSFNGIAWDGSKLWATDATNLFDLTSAQAQDPSATDVDAHILTGEITLGDDRRKHVRYVSSLMAPSGDIYLSCFTRDGSEKSPNDGNPLTPGSTDGDFHTERFGMPSTTYSNSFQIKLGNGGGAALEIANLSVKVMVGDV